MRILKIFALFLGLSIEALAVVQFSGSAFTTSFATTGVKQDLINSIETALLNGGSGWTTISGHLTANLLMQSGTTPQSLQIRARIKDNGGAAIQVYLENRDSSLAGTETSNLGASLLATVGKIYFVVGSRYQFVIYSAANAARSFVWVGMPYMPTAVAAIVTDAGWLSSNSVSDGDATVRNNPSSITAISDANPVTMNLLLNGSFWVDNADNSTQNSGIGTLRMVFMMVCSEIKFTLSSPNTYRWTDNSIATGDILIAWGRYSAGYPAKIWGQVWDAIYIQDAVASNTTATFSGHLFQVITNNYAGSAGNFYRGGLWFATN